MNYIIFGALLFLLFYVPLRYLKNLWEHESAPDWATTVAGILTWLMLCSVLLIVYGAFRTATGSIFLLAFVIVGAGFLMYLNNVSPEFLDLPHMIPFLKKTLVFDNIAGKRINLSDELAKLEMRKVYKEVTGTELQQKEKAPPKQQQRTEDIQREMELLQNRRIVTPHLQQELNALEKSESTNISDSWKINSMRSAAHAYYTQVKTVLVNPAERTITVTMDFGEMDIVPMQQSQGVFVFYRELYEFLQAMNTQDWMKPYVKYIDIISLVGTRVETDGFGTASSLTFLRLSILVSELRSREEKFFNAAELPAISTVLFKSGEALL
ncbi:MAG: hypothetical protein L0Y80_12760 [Ignavibacteriae bacterium]|nr:hypothetical protein [Ignavibacteriota bacterium]